MEVESRGQTTELKMRCSVVILNWNGADMLRRYLPSVVQYTTMADTEIVVADNGSTDDSKAVVEGFPTVRWIALDTNYGFAEGYNKSLEGIESEYTVLLNSDVEVSEGWLTPLLDFMDSHKMVGATMPKIRSDRDRTKFEHAGAAGGYMDRLMYPYCRGRILGYVEEDKGQYDTIERVFWATGACLCVRTSIYKELGGLDKDFFAHMEEIDLCWRMQCRGYALYCIPQSVVYHLGGGALGYESPRKTYLNFRNNLLMIYKNLPTNRLIGVWMMRWVLDYAAALQLLLSGKGKNAWAVCQARCDFWKMRKAMRIKRQENKEKAIVPYPETIANRSILFDYYLRGKRQ